MRWLGAALLFLGTASMATGLLADLPYWPRYTDAPPPDLWLARGLTLREWLLFAGAGLLIAGILLFLVGHIAAGLRSAASARAARGTRQ